MKKKESSSLNILVHHIGKLHPKMSDKKNVRNSIKNVINEIRVYDWNCELAY